jgi:hypothetical protein
LSRLLSLVAVANRTKKGQPTHPRLIKNPLPLLILDLFKTALEVYVEHQFECELDPSLKRCLVLRLPVHSQNRLSMTLVLNR